jgi:spore germination cell wall hydrolase CwlJ-like protein
MKIILSALLSLLSANLYSMSGYQQQVVAAGLILEASSDGPEGLEAVFSVIVNRALCAGKTPLQILTRPGQFSAMSSVWNKAKPNFSPLIAKAKKDKNWQIALDIVNTYEGGMHKDTVFGSTHYHTKDIRPAWAKSNQLKYNMVVGEHIFYAPTGNFTGVALF